ncbi:Na+/H+ antiporter subunit E [Pseudothermotoga sp.]
MRKIAFIAFGIALWIFLTPTLEIEVLLTALIASYVAARLVGNVKLRPMKILNFTVLLAYNFLVAVWQSLKIVLGLFDYESKYFEEPAGRDFLEKFEKIVLITLTPFTIVVDEKENVLIIHELKRRKGTE